ncbi:MAG: transcriptional regulator, PadR-like family [Phycisphaerales bacterium]|nr:transcriptional regulator, PadR-like family [Phycisphaerales bacterium]
MENKSQFLKGCARTLVLQLLGERPMYGYEIATALAERSRDIFALGQGTLYPLLYSLEGKGLIRVAREEKSPEQGRRRRYYQLTPTGRQELEASLVTWREIARGMRLVLGGANA